MVILLGARWYVLLLLYRASHEDKAQLNIVIYELITKPCEEALRAILDAPVSPIDGEDRAGKRICPLIYIIGIAMFFVTPLSVRLPCST